MVLLWEICVSIISIPISIPKSIFCAARKRDRLSVGLLVASSLLFVFDVKSRSSDAPVFRGRNTFLSNRFAFSSFVRFPSHPFLHGEKTNPLALAIFNRCSSYSISEWMHRQHHTYQIVVTNFPIRTLFRSPIFGSCFLPFRWTFHSRKWANQTITKAGKRVWWMFTPLFWCWGTDFIHSVRKTR